MPEQVMKANVVQSRCAGETHRWVAHFWERKGVKTHLTVVILAVMFLVVACSASPEKTSTRTPTISLSPSASDTSPDRICQTYTNAEVGFSILFPSNWQVEALPDDNAGQLHQIALKGPEGVLELHWGVGLGGACPEGYQLVRVAQGELPACYS
jgi:hypothetical protein